MAGLAGGRGSARRKLVICGACALGAAVLLLVGYMAETSTKQVYWAVYSRLHPMRDGTESYAFSRLQPERRVDLKSSSGGAAGVSNAVTSGSEGLGILDDGVDQGTAAAAAVAAGEKRVVALLPTEKEQISNRGHEQTAARQAHQREAEVQEAKEHKRVQDLAEQQLAKATAAYSAEIAAVAGPEEAGRLETKLRTQAGHGQTQLEKEAAATAGTGTMGKGAQLLRKLYKGPTLASRGPHRAVLDAAPQSDADPNNSNKSSSPPPPPRHKSRRGKRRRQEHAASRASGAGEQREGKASEQAAAATDSGTQNPHKASKSATTSTEEGLLSAAGAALGSSRQDEARHTTGGRRSDSRSELSPSAKERPKPGRMTRVRKWSGDPTSYLLTKERVEATASPDGVIMLTWANHHYLDFAMNWVGHLQLLGVTAYMVGALDNDFLKDLVEMGVDNVFAMQTDLEAGDLSWGSPHFFEMGREKIQLIEKFATMGFDVIVSDIDTVWLKDPLPYMARYPEADILASTDHITNTTNDDGLEKFPDAGSACNIGIILFRRSALDFAKEWNKVLGKDELYWDQNAFNDLLRRNMEFHVKRPSRLFSGYDMKLLVGILPVALFASGHTFYVQDLAKKMGLEPYVVHGTFQFSGTDGKRHRFRERHIWLPDEDSYFKPPGGLLSFDLRVNHLLEPASRIKLNGKIDDLHGHFDLANAQLLQIRNALAVASALNRTVLLPRMFTGVDRWWSPHLGLIPGAERMSLPMYCPADHILDINVMATKLDAKDYGPDIAFKEYSFLENPRTDARLAADRVRITICPEFDYECTSTANNTVRGASDLRLQYGLNDRQLATIFEAYNETQTLHFDDMSRGVGTFASDDDLEKFQQRTKVYASIWCCVDRHPGHIWYDMWWDRPHVDRHNRQFGAWELLTGP